MRPLGRALIQSDWCPHKKRKLDKQENIKGTGTHSDNHVKRVQAGGHLHAREAGLRGNQAAQTLNLDIQPPKVGGNTVMCLKSLILSLVFCYGSLG